jgi:hypothetical protein
MALDLDDRPEADRLYEIGLDGDVSEAIRRSQPAAQVVGSGTSTILWTRLHRPDDLQVLLDALSDYGITPCEIHESAGGSRPDRLPASGLADLSSARPPYCEVRIVGRLGAAVLHHLGWSHRVARTTVVRLRASRLGLRIVLAQLSTVTGVDYVVSLGILQSDPD